MTDPNEATRALDQGSGPSVEHTEPGHSGEEGLERGTSVGRYIVLDRIGTGGMGVVYAAYDPELDRRIAVKLLRPRGRSKVSSARSRLIREAQAMAKLSHPNVLPVYDVGEVGEQIFVAIEYIDGETLGDWLRQGPHAVDHLLGYFIPAGKGLAAAHAEGLVHRDFKPHNVLIGRRGEVRVMDFGLARPAADSLNASGDSDRVSDDAPIADLTATGTVMGTPGYMAPEQYKAASVDHRADQYSFCVALYEALYGARPFGGKTAKEIYRAVAAQRFAAPVFDRGVPGWLRKAVVRGLAMAPEDRWPDMSALLAALERDRTRRRRIAFFGLGAVTVATTVGVVSFQAATAEAKCDSAGAPIREVWNDEAEASARVAFEQTGLPYAVETWSRTAPVLAKYADSWAAQRVEACEATQLRGVQSDALLDRRMACLDRRRQEFEGLLRVFDVADAATVERSLRAARGLPPLARCADTEALAAAVEPPGDPATRNAVADIRGELGRIRALVAAGRYKEILAAAERALGEAEETSYRPVIAEAKLAYARGLLHAGKFEPAEPAGREAALVAEELGMDSLGASAHVFLTRLVGNKLARHDEALRHGETALAKLDRIAADGRRKAGLYTWMAETADLKGDYVLSREYAQRSMDLWKESAPDGPQYAMSVGNFGRVAYRERDFEGAKTYFERGLTILRDVHGDHHPEVAKAMSNVAATFHALGRFEEARSTLVEVVAILEASIGTEHHDFAISLSNLSNAHLRLKDYDEALRLAKRALEIKQKVMGEKHPTCGYSLNNVALLLYRLERFEDSLSTYRQAAEVLEAALGPDHPGVIEPKLGIGEVLVRLKRYDDAIAPLTSALQSSKQSGDPPERLAPAQYLLAKALWSASVARRDRARATELARQARGGFEAAKDESTLARLDEWLDSREP